MKFLAPSFSGRMEVPADVPDFRERMRARVEAGFLNPGASARNSYTFEARPYGACVIRAANLRAAVNVGLNEVELRLDEGLAIEYRVRYWRWAMFCVGLCGVLGVMFVALYVISADVRADVAAWPLGRLMFWGNVVFWGGVWPWVLVALHKRVAERVLRRILTEAVSDPDV